MRQKKSLKVSSVLLASEKPEMAELLPDIQKLFRHYNAIYFDEALGACSVTWAPRMRSSTGTCRFIEAGRCEIRLSESLLKPRSSSDLKNSLLHEMVHAFLWIKEKNKNRSKHGSNFWAIANEINSNSKDDDQRPSNGYSISDEHKFHDEAVISAVHHWMCDSCGHLTKREISREPSPSDCLEKIGHDGDCGKLSCEWHRHKKLCSGRFNKMDISGFRGKEKAVEGAKENDESKHTDLCNVTKRTRRFQPAEERKDVNSIKRQMKLIHFCSSVSDKTKCSENKSFQKNFSNSATGQNILKYQRRTCKKNSNDSNIEKNKSYRRKREVTLVIPWLGVYTDEESEEEKETLVNKRSVKRMKLKESKKRSGQIDLTPEAVIYLD